MDDNIKNANAGTKKKITDFRCLKDVESKNVISEYLKIATNFNY